MSRPSDRIATPWGLSTDAALAANVRRLELETEAHKLESRLADVRRQHALEARRAGCDSAFAYCSACGSREIEWEDWVDAQTGLATGSLYCGKNWCPQCEDGDASITFERREAALARYARMRKRADGCDCDHCDYSGIEPGESIAPHEHHCGCSAYRVEAAC